MNEKEFKSHIRKKDYARLYFITGEEKFLVKHYTEEFVKKVMGEKPPEFNFHELDSDSSVDEIAVASDVMPFMSKYNFVKISDYDIGSLLKSDFEKLNIIINNIPDTTILLFTFPTTSPSGQNYNSILRYVKQNGIFVEMEHYNKLKLGATLVEGAYNRSCPMSENTADVLIDYCGTDLVLLRNELDKLCAYADGQEITVDMINLLVHQTLETKLYYLTDNIIYGNLTKAYSDLEILFYQKVEPIVIVGAIGSAYIDLYRARVAAESAIPIARVAEDFGYGKRKFILEKSGKKSRNLSTEQIRECINVIITADQDLKSTSADDKVLIEKLIAKLVLISQHN
ncbi:MAG: DNA polymerase III subunit delta [Ruminococcus sp.]|nr:DNA polymerase III subunit delta [Ruminococcus sp.]